MQIFCDFWIEPYEAIPRGPVYQMNYNYGGRLTVPANFIAK